MWASIIAFGAVLLAITSIAIAAINKYSSEDAARVLTWVSAIFGTVVGMAGGFFFSKEAIDQTRTAFEKHTTAIGEDVSRLRIEFERLADERGRIDDTLGDFGARLASISEKIAHPNSPLDYNTLNSYWATSDGLMLKPPGQLYPTDPKDERDQETPLIGPPVNKREPS